MTPRDDRDRLEALQAEVRALELERERVRQRLAEAKETAAQARRREREAALSRGPLLPWGPLRRISIDALRFAVISILVVAAFAVVLGTVTFAIHSYNESISRRFAR